MKIRGGLLPICGDPSPDHDRGWLLPPEGSAEVHRDGGLVPGQHPVILAVVDGLHGEQFLVGPEHREQPVTGEALKNFLAMDAALLFGGL